MIKVLFVCRANICRSPTAHAVLQRLLAEQGLTEKIEVDSAGTDAPYPGRVPDKRARTVAQDRGYDLSALHAQQLTSEIAADSDYIIVMDDRNFNDAKDILAVEDLSKMKLLLAYTDSSDQQLRDPFFSGSDLGHGFIPDPIDSGERAFTSTLKQIERACALLLENIRSKNDL